MEARNSNSLFLTLKQADVTEYTKGPDLQNSVMSFTVTVHRRKYALIHSSQLQSYNIGFKL